MTESEPTAPPPRAAFVFLFITVLLDMLALGIVVPHHLLEITHLIRGSVAFTHIIGGRNFIARPTVK
jgi:hypothetical protein